MAFIGFVLECGSIDGDTSGFLLRGLVDFGILDILSLVLLSQKFRDGRSKGCFSVIDMSDRSNWITFPLPLTWGLARSNLAKAWQILSLRKIFLDRAALNIFFNHN